MKRIVRGIVGGGLVALFVSCGKGGDKAESSKGETAQVALASFRDYVKKTFPATPFTGAMVVTCEIKKTDVVKAESTASPFTGIVEASSTMDAGVGPGALVRDEFHVKFTGEGAAWKCDPGASTGEHLVGGVAKKPLTGPETCSGFAFQCGGKPKDDGASAGSVTTPDPKELPASCIEYGDLIENHCEKLDESVRKKIKDGLFPDLRGRLAKASDARELATMVAEFSKTCTDMIEKAKPVCGAAEAGKPVESGEAAKLKDSVKFDHSEWVVLSAAWKGRHLASNNQFQKALTIDEGKLVLVQFKVRNNLKEKTAVKEPKLRDSTGRVFEPLESAAFYVPDGKKTAGMMEEVPPTISKEFWEPYQVADDSTGLVLLTHDVGGNMFEDDPNVKPVALDLK